MNLEKYSSKSILSPETLEDLEELKKKLYQQVKRLKEKFTPKDQIEKKGGFEFASWSYMLDEMDKNHPLRRETFVTPPTIERKSMTYSCAVMVEDLITHETRIGFDIHPIVAFDKESDRMKDPKTVRELLGNAGKASVTKALRHAYSNFGVSSDLYGSMVKEEVTDEQSARFFSLAEIMTQYFVGAVNPKLSAWWDAQVKAWSTQSKLSADKFLDTLTPYVKKYEVTNG